MSMINNKSKKFSDNIINVQSQFGHCYIKIKKISILIQIITITLSILFILLLLLCVFYLFKIKHVFIAIYALIATILTAVYLKSDLLLSSETITFYKNGFIVAEKYDYNYQDIDKVKAIHSPRISGYYFTLFLSNTHKIEWKCKYDIAEKLLMLFKDKNVYLIKANQ